MRGPARRYVLILVPVLAAGALLGGAWLTRSRVACGATPAGSDVALSTAQVVCGRLPVIVGPTLAGASFDRASLGGKIVIVNVWNPDCTPCRKEAPAIAAAARVLQRRGVTIVGLMFIGGDWPDDRDAARRFVARYGLRYPVVVDVGSKVADALAIPGIPTTFVADATGELRYRIIGPVRPGQLESVVASLTGSG